MNLEFSRSVPSFCRATDNLLTKQIRSAKSRIIFLAPGVSHCVAKELVNAHENTRTVTAIIDAEEEVCRIGYGDVDGFKHLTHHGRKIGLRKHSGVRLGLLIADRSVTVWSPTPRAVDGDRKPDQPNAIVLDGRIAEDSNATDASQDEMLDQAVTDGSQPVDGTVESSTPSLAEQLAKGLCDASIGEQKIAPRDLEPVVKELTENPPAPFDLARKVRVFSTKFQYVETELQGADWTSRRIKLSGSLLNSDLPDSLREIFDTQIHPYRTKGDIAISVPCIVRGQIAYNKCGEKIRAPITQREMEGMWKDIQERYLFSLPGFGKLVRKRELPDFRDEVEAFECVLEDWSTQFRTQANQDEDSLVSDIVDSIKRRIDQSGRKEKLQESDLDTIVRSGLQGMRVIPPRVRIVIKNVSWESSRDQEFTAALQENLPVEDLRGWFDEFVAVKERD